MRLVNVLLLCASGLLFTSPSPQNGGWRGIVPLHSTRTDVERLLGKPNFRDDLYDFESERVRIMYTREPCTGGLQGSYNVPPDTIISIDVVPKRRLMLSELNLDLRKYKKTTDPLIEVHSSYSNDEEGVSIGTVEGGKENGKILYIYYGPAAKDSQLRCSSPPPSHAGKVNCSRAKQVDDSTGPLSDPCPTILITGPSGDLCRGQRYTFSATLAGGDPRFTPTYKWIVSAGTIVSGQGTYAIEVDANGTNGNPITATLEVGGAIPEGCQKIERYATGCPKPNVTTQR